MLCSSYSGSTEETLATYDAARAAGAPRIVATTGGPLAERARARRRARRPAARAASSRAPRSATRSSSRSRRPRLCGAAPSLREEVGAAAALAAELAREWGPEGDEEGDAEAARPRAPRRDPRHHRRGPDGVGRVPLEDARSTRTRSCRRSSASCRSRTTTRSWAGPAPTSAWPPCSSRTPGRRARRPPDRGDGGARRRGRLRGRARDRARRVARWSGSSRSSCSATWSRSTWRCCAASTPCTSARSTRSRSGWPPPTRSVSPCPRARWGRGRRRAPRAAAAAGSPPRRAPCATTAARTTWAPA